MFISQKIIRKRTWTFYCYCCKYNQKTGHYLSDAYVLILAETMFGQGQNAECTRTLNDI